MATTSVPSRRRPRRTQRPGPIAWTLSDTDRSKTGPTCRLDDEQVATLEDRLAAWRVDHLDLWQKDDWHAPLVLAVDLAVIAAVAIATEMHPIGPKWLWYGAVALPVISTRMRALATLLHEGVHGALMRSSQLERWLATYGSSYLVCQTWFAYIRSHVGKHHGKFGDPAHDPDLAAHVELGLYEHRTATGFVLRRVVAPLLGVDHPRMVAELLRSRAGNLSDERARGELLRMVAWLAFVLGLLALVVGPQAVLLYWLLPFLYGFPLANWYAELAEHFPYPMTRPGDRLAQTRERATGPISRQLIGIHGEDHHWVHHLFHRMPYWRQGDALELLRAEMPEVEELLRSQGADRWRPFGLLRQYVEAGREVARWNRTRDGEA